jgi:hypothetical protein
MKTISKTSAYTFFEQIIVNSIDLDAYDIAAKDNFEKVQETYKVFLSEKGYEIKRVGERPAFTDWLQGLPTVLTVPFYYYEQLKLAKKSNLIPKDASEDQEDEFTQSWFAKCTAAFFTLKENL